MCVTPSARRSVTNHGSATGGRARRPSVRPARQAATASRRGAAATARRGHAAAGREQRRDEALRRRRAHGVTAVHRPRRRRRGCWPASAHWRSRRHDGVVVGDDHGGRDVDRRRSTTASRTAASPARPPGSASSRAGRPPRSPTTPSSRRSRQPVHLPSAALVRRPSGTAPASALVPVATPVRTRSRVVPRNEALVAHSTSPATRSRWRRQTSWATGPPIE